MNINGKPNAMTEEALKQVVGGRKTPQPKPADPTESWSETENIPVELPVAGRVGCPKPGCNENILVWDGSSKTYIGGKEENCFRYHCELCKTYFAKSDSSGIWYIRN